MDRFPSDSMFAACSCTSLVRQEHTQIRSEEAMTRLAALHVKPSRAVTCLRGFRPWRLAALPARRLPAALRPTDDTRRAGPSRAELRTAPGRHAPNTAAQTLQEAPERPGAARAARSPLGPNMGFLPAIFGNVRHAGVFIKPGILREALTELKFKLSPSARGNTNQTHTVNVVHFPR